ncbi:uncharacterized protein LOC135685011 [Rhopilema esculentum]|uniref:uncharacterized protein LOC135685011 n=1 Tax=Rhopilema esculentum TaxID=499914 RepID=UPI0031E06CA5
MAPLIRLGSVLFAVDHYDHLFDGFNIKLSNIDMASAFLSQNCSSFKYEKRPKNSPSIDELLHHVISHEIMITSVNGEFSGPLQVHFISGLINRPINLNCEFSNHFCYAGRVNPCPCSEQRTYGNSLNIMWTNFADDGEDRINHVIPVYHVRGK